MPDERAALSMRQIKEIIVRTTVANTGYGVQEAEAYAQGVVDALTAFNPVLIKGPLALDQDGIELVAQRLVNL